MSATLHETLQRIENTAPRVLEVLTGANGQRGRDESGFVGVLSEREYTDVQDIATFFFQVETALQQVESVLNDLERRMEVRGALYPAEIDLDSEFEDFETSIAQYQRIQTSLQQLASLHRFVRLSLDERERLLGAYVTGDTNKVLVRTFPHTVARYETLESIAAQYGIADWRTLAEHNAVLASDLEAGDVLHVPIRLSPTEAAQVVDALPVFGSLAGESSFGRDLPNELKTKVVSETGGEEWLDLQVLAPLDTIGQGLQNTLATSPGEHPTNRAFGFSGVISDDIPSDVRESWMRARAEEVLLQDPRVEAVRVDSVASEGQSVSLDVTVFPKASNPIRIER